MASRIAEGVEFGPQSDAEGPGDRQREDRLIGPGVDQGNRDGVIVPWSRDPQRDLGPVDRPVGRRR